MPDGAASLLLALGSTVVPLIAVKSHGAEQMAAPAVTSRRQGRVPGSEDVRMGENGVRGEHGLRLSVVGVLAIALALLWVLAWMFILVMAPIRSHEWKTFIPYGL